MFQPLSNMLGTQGVSYSSEDQGSVIKIIVEVHKGPLALPSVWNGYLNDTMLKLKITEGLESSSCRGAGVFQAVDPSQGRCF